MSANDNSKDANAFDLELFRLMRRAQQLGENRLLGRGTRGRWLMIARSLLDVRPMVRMMMTEADRGTTA